jgi:hypothetical protein
VNEEIPIRPESIDPGRSVIVVSDLHLGGTEDPHTSARFSRFLEYVSRLYPGSGPVPAEPGDPGTPNLLPPQKFILLGDFFDTWDPRCQDRNNVLLDGMIPIARIGQMDCDVVFVTGNHDEDIGELVDLQRRIENNIKSDPCRKELDPCEKGTGLSGQETDPYPERSIRYIPPVNEGTPDEGTRGLDFRTRTGRKFSIYQKSYIPGPKREGLDVGGVHYAFLHGHQFDLEQITYRISEFLKKRFDPVSVIVDYANTGLAKSISIRQSLLFLALWVPALFISSNTCGFGTFTPVFGGTAFAIFALMVLYQSYIYKVAPESDDSSRLLGCTLAVFVIFVALLVAGLFFRTIFGILFSVAFWVLTFVAVVISIPKIFAYAKRATYNRIKVRDKTVEQVVGKDDKEQRRYFRPENFTIGANVVIFGHTHCAGKYPFTIPDISDNPQRGKHFYLINSGGWVRVNSTKEPRPGVPADPCKDHIDTFVYIDANGALLMKWVEDQAEGKPCKGRVRVISHVPRSALLQSGEV